MGWPRTNVQVRKVGHFAAVKVSTIGLQTDGPMPKRNEFFEYMRPRATGFVSLLWSPGGQSEWLSRGGTYSAEMCLKERIIEWWSKQSGGY